MLRRPALIAMPVTALLLGALGAGTASADGPATDLYVNSFAGNCSHSGPGTQTIPFCAIQDAADVVGPGQTVHIINSAQPTSPVVISRSGTAGAPITFTGGVPGSADTTVSTAAGTASSTGLFTLKDVQYVVLDHLSLSSAGTAVSVISSEHITLDRTDVSGSDSIYAPSSAPVDAITVDGSSSDVSISHAVAQYVSGSGIAVQSGASHVVVASEVIDSVGSAIQASGVSDLEVAGNTLTSMGGGVAVTGTSTGSIENTVVIPHDMTTSATQPAISVSAGSTGGFTADYNAVTADRSGVEYDWGGTSYTSVAAFRAAADQGQHDIDGLPGRTGDSGLIAEGSPIVDSGAADAPGQSPTDYRGLSRVDDPEVANTGSADGYVDRGAMEYQDPFRLIPRVSPAAGPAPLSVTVSATVYNPWGTTARYSIDFGDGSPAGTSSTPTATHTYPTVGGPFRPTVTATLPSGEQRSYANPSVTVNAPGPLVEAVALTTNGLSATVKGRITSPWLFSGGTANFGDGSAPVTIPAYNPDGIVHTYAAPGSYTVTGTVSDEGGRTVPFTRKITVGGQYVTVPATRILDTRNGTGAAKHKVGPGGVLRLKVAGVAGVPISDVGAVTMNVTDTNSSTGGWVVAYADGTTRPAVGSNLNFKAGETNPNLVTVPVGKDGYVDLYNAFGTVDLIADVQGYYSTAWTMSSAGQYVPFAAPVRDLDIRNGPGEDGLIVKPFGAGWSVTAMGLAGGSDSGTAMVLNLTSLNADSSGWVAAMPADGTRPAVSNLNYAPGRTTSNLAVVPGDDAYTLYNSSGHVGLIVDAQGYFIRDYGSANAVTGADYVPLTPTRVADTRIGNHHLGTGSTLRIKVVGTHGIPVGTTAVNVNLTGTGSSKSTYVIAYGGGKTPRSSNLNLVPGQTRPVLATVPVDSSGYITVYNYNGTVDVIADLEGYYAPSP